MKRSIDIPVVPRVQGYRFPAEWEPHRATWLSLPLNDESWPGKMNFIYEAFFAFVKHISEGEKVCINVHNRELADFTRETAEKKGSDLRQLELYIHPSNDCWCRDHGPAFLVNESGEKLLLNWQYNGWGNKYAWDLDTLIPDGICKAMNYKKIDIDMVLEGGSVELNGNGTLLTTTSCLLNKNRNPRLTANDIEKKLIDHYGVEQILWLDHGIAGDDTDGHVDDMTRFISRNTVLTAIEHDAGDINYGPLSNNRKKLDDMRLPDGKPLNIIELPMPPRLYNGADRLPASYANFYIANRKVIVPVFQAPTDEKALEIIQDAFPDREVCGIDSRVLVEGSGSFHCLSQQEPL